MTWQLALESFLQSWSPMKKHSHTPCAMAHVRCSIGLHPSKHLEDAVFLGHRNLAWECCYVIQFRNPSHSAINIIIPKNTKTFQWSSTWSIPSKVIYRTEDSLESTDPRFVDSSLRCISLLAMSPSAITAPTWFWCSSWSCCFCASDVASQPKYWQTCFRSFYDLYLTVSSHIFQVIDACFRNSDILAQVAHRACCPIDRCFKQSFQSSLSLLKVVSDAGSTPKPWSSATVFEKTMAW